MTFFCLLLGLSLLKTGDKIGFKPALIDILPLIKVKTYLGCRFPDIRRQMVMLAIVNALPTGKNLSYNYGL